MDGIKPKTITLGNVEGNGQWMQRQGKNGEPDKIFLRTGSMIGIKKIFDNIRGIKTAPLAITKSLERTLHFHNLKLSNSDIKKAGAYLSFDDTIKFTTKSKIENKPTKSILKDLPEPEKTFDAMKTHINNLRIAVDLDNIKFDKSHPDYENLKSQKDHLEETIKDIAFISTSYEPIDDNIKKLGQQKQKLISQLAVLSTTFEKGYHRSPVWEKRMDNLQAEINKINFTQEKKQSAWDNFY